MKASTQLVVLAMVMFGCASGAVRPRPLYLESPDHHPRFPVSSYLTAVGRSSTGSEQARHRAMAEVSRQISATLESEMSIWEREVHHNGQVEGDARYSEEIVVRSGFADLNLIHIDEASSWEGDGLYYAFAYLNRREADQALALKSAPTASSFDENYRQARAAFESDDPAAFVRARAEALPAAEELRENVSIRRAILGGETPELTQFRERYMDLVRMDSAIRDRVRIGLDVRDAQGAPTRRIQEQVAEALKEMGLVSDSHTDCSDAREVLRYTVRVEPVTECRRGHLGLICEARVVMAGYRCGNDSPLFRVEVGGSDARGAHPRDEARAMEKAYGKITGEMLLPLLREAVGRHLPIRREP